MVRGVRKAASAKERHFYGCGGHKPKCRWLRRGDRDCWRRSVHHDNQCDCMRSEGMTHEQPRLRAALPLYMHLCTGHALAQPVLTTLPPPSPILFSVSRGIDRPGCNMGLSYQTGSSATAMPSARRNWLADDLHAAYYSRYQCINSVRRGIRAGPCVGGAQKHARASVAQGCSVHPYCHAAIV